MGLFPFASTVGTMSYSSSEAAGPCPAHGSWRPGGAIEWGGPQPDSRPAATRRPALFSPVRSRPFNRFASCLSSARCPDAVARPADIRRGVSRRTSGQTLSRSERGDHATVERSPPSPPRPPC